MAPRRRAAAAAAAAAAVEEEQEEEHDMEGLQFRETLSWKPGKPISNAELLRRLDTLSKELADLDQDFEHKESLTKVAKELCAQQILGHKDKGVKAFAACCLVDILKICAPDAPFTPSQLKDIFTSFITVILPALRDPAHPYNNQHKYVLTSLAEVQSILLLDEIPNNEALFKHLFTTFFDTVSDSASSSKTSNTGEEVGKDVEYQMTRILEMLIDEASTIPAKVIEVIMAQFLRAAAPGAARHKKEQPSREDNQSTLLPKEEPPAYQMARAICLENPEKMARYVGQYFADVILEASGLGRNNGRRAAEDSDDEEEVAGISNDDLAEMRKAHLLIRELWKAAPMVLQNVILQVDAELSADDVHMRQLATETLGDVIAGIGAAGPPPPPVMDPAAYPPHKLSDDIGNTSLNPLTTPLSPQSFAQTYPTVYQNFLGRKKDKSPVIRASWTLAVGYILSTNAGGIGFSRDEEKVLVRGLGEQLGDSDDKVRLAGVKAIETFSFRDLILKLAPDGGLEKSESVLSTLADRIRDRRPQVRVDAMALLGKLWAVSSGEIAAGNDIVVSALSAAPSRIYNIFYTNDQETNVLLDRVIFECLVPLSYPPPKKASKGANGSSQAPSNSQAAAVGQDADVIRAERILLMVHSLDVNAKKAFFAIQARQPQFAGYLRKFLTSVEDYNGGVMDQNAERKTAQLKGMIHYLSQFLPDEARTKAELNKFAKANDRRNIQLIKFITGAENDFKTVYRALKELMKRLQGSQSIGLSDVLVPLLYRSGYLLFNRSHLSTFLDYSRTDQDGLGATAHELLNEITQRTPDLFKTHIGELCKTLGDQAPTATRANEPAVVETLKACSSYARKYPDEIPSDRKFVQTLMNFALYGKPEKAAKYAVNILLVKGDDKSMVNATELLQKVMKDWKYGSPHFINKLATMSQLELLAPKVTEEHDDVVLDMAVQKILKEVRAEASDKDPDWVEDADMDEEIRAKLLSLKLLVNRLRSKDDTGESDVQERVKPVFKLLKTLINKHGELCKVKNTPQHHKARLRLLAGELVLKLCRDKRLDDLLPPDDFNALALVAQDTWLQTRQAFLQKLIKYLGQTKLRPKFYTIVFLTAFEPHSETKRSTATWIRSKAQQFQNTRQHVMESTMPRLLSLLAHHPDFALDVQELEDHAKYILYYLSNVATEANLGMIFRYVEKVKQTRDAIKPEMSENLHVVSDLALAVIRKWQEKKGWTFEVYGPKVGLPNGLFLTLASHDEAQAISEKQYIPEELDAKLDKVIREWDHKKKRKSTDDRGDGQPAAKKSKSSSKPAQPRVSKLAVRPSSKPTKKAPSKPRTPAKPKKSREISGSSSLADSERRRSGRSRKSNTYVDRDSSDDDEEMLEGVAEWRYEEDGSGVEDAAGDDDKDSGAEEDVPEPMDEDEKEEEAVPETAAPDVEDADDSVLSDPKDDEEEKDDDEENGEDEEEEEKEEEEEVEMPPPATNSRRSRTAAAAAAPKAKPSPKAKAAPKAAPKVKKASPKTKAVPAAKASRATRARKAKDSYDVEED